MSVAFYMDEHVPGLISAALRQRGVDVVTAQDDSHDGSPDDILLGRATSLGRCLVSIDKDYFTVVARRQVAQVQFAGVISLPSAMTHRAAIDDLEMLAKCSEPAEWEGKITRLPL